MPDRRFPECRRQLDDRLLVADVDCDHPILAIVMYWIVSFMPTIDAAVMS